MLENLPIYITFAFGVTTVATLFLMIWTIKNSTSQMIRKKSMLLFFSLTIWLTMQAVLTLYNCYNTDTDFYLDIWHRLDNY